MEGLPEVATADHEGVAECVYVGPDLPPLEHDYRPYVRTKMAGGKQVSHTFLRCVFCHAVTCGNCTQTDPCIEPYHHRGDHRTQLGVTWAKGTTRPRALRAADLA